MPSKIPTRSTSFRNRRPEAVEEGVAAGEPVERALMAEIRVRHDGLRAVRRDDVRPALLYFCERLIPRNAAECSTSFRTDAPHRIEQAIWIIMMRCEIVELYAQPAARHRVIGIARNLQ